MKINHRCAAILATLAMMFGGAAACQAGLGVTYVKTLGQNNPTGQPLKGTGLRQLAVDTEGNLYYAIIRGWPWTSLVKVAPGGRVIWETECGGYSAVPVTIADGHLYALSQSEIRRFSLAAGQRDADWGGKLPATLREVAALQIAGTYLFLVDKAGHELHRFDRATLDEKPFATRVMVVEPVDCALARNGNLLILTAETVLEVDPNGRPVRVPLIDGLHGAQGMAVDPRTGLIFVMQGGIPGSLVNQIWQYDADGKPTGVKLGRGGDFNGKWSPDSFAFSSGYAAFALDAQGGLWVNNALGQLVHFKAGEKFMADQTLVGLSLGGVGATGIAVDDQLNLYVGMNVGGLKLSWDNQVVWTSGLQISGDGARFPSSPVNGWPVYVACAGAKGPVFYSTHDGTAWLLSPATGELLGTRAGPGQGGSLFLRAAGDSLFLKTGNSGQISQGAPETIGDWKAWKSFLTLPADLKAGQLVGGSRDQARIYLHDGKTLFCVGKDGKRLWETAAPAIGYVFPVAFLRDDVMFLNLAGKTTALDARTGEKLAEIGTEPAADGRPALGGGGGFAVGSKGGKDYLFVLGNYQVQVFEITTTVGAK